MSGHSKWATIKHKKAAVDAKKGAVYTKLIREITIAARMGGGDANGNPRLRMAVDKARGANMPNDNIDRAIKKGTGALEGITYEDFLYEGFGPGGVAVMLDGSTDNKNRTASEVRKIFSKHNGNLGASGSVRHMFSKKGLITFDKAVNEDKIMEIALEAGADDVLATDDGFEVTCDPAEFEKVRDTIRKAGLPPVSAEVSMIPQNTVRVEGKEARVVLNLVEALEAQDDVQNVYANFDIDEQDME